ncbi:MAG: DUF1127 domain-containing protein [SAR324 cluster bacterium]|nr:DUF1127 domain-containing protein [SAR324 cluster bacterium]
MSNSIAAKAASQNPISYLVEGTEPWSGKTLWDASAFYRLGLYLEEKWETLKLWKERIEYRRSLNFLNDHLLEDVGLTRDDVENEQNKWFWQK